MKFLSIEPRQTNDERVYLFLLWFELPDGAKAFSCLAAHEVNEYARMQNMTLQQTGRLYLNPAAEGKPAEVADWLWRSQVAEMLNVLPLKAQDAPPLNLN